MNKKKRILYLLFFNLALGGYAQENFFGDVGVIKTLSSTTKWDQSVYGHFKHFFTEDGWYQLGSSYRLTRNLGNWGVQTGIVMEHTFDGLLGNYWEIRPWAGLTLVNNISSNFKFHQSFRFEWRNLLFGDNIENRITTRTRFRIRPAYELDEKWSFYTSYEWYIMRNVDFGARFVNSREWSIGFNRRMKKFILNINYTRERFNSVIVSDVTGGNTLSAIFIF